MKKFLLPIYVLFPFFVFAQDKNITEKVESSNTATELQFSDDIFDVSLEDLLNMQVSVASKSELSTKESPGVVTVITETEIKNSGARDLIDVLRVVPGFNFAQDVQGVVGLGMRGNWGHEGKILLLLDGQEMNELLFSTTYFGNRFDVSQIKRIEIIRGPGSSIYGGNAELGVINIITKTGKDLEGIEVTGTAGVFSDTYSRQNISAAIGKSTEDLKWSVSGFLGRGQRSNSYLKDVYGDSASMIDKSATNPSQLNVGLSYKELSARWISEDYINTSKSMFDVVEAKAYKVEYQMHLGELKYELKLSDKITLTPKINYTSQKPWKITDEDYSYQFNATKTTGGLHLNYDITDKINFIAGGEYFIESAKNTNTTSDAYFYNGKNEINFNTMSGYGQFLVKSKIANFTAGLKAINHNKFGAAFAPRIGVTKAYKNFHAKVLYNVAFRAPAIENINFNPNIKPEITNVFEIEAGYQIRKNMLFTINYFDIRIQKPIIYYVNVDENNLGSYENFNKTGSKGIEAEYKLTYKAGYLGLNYSYYTSSGINDVPNYAVLNHGGSLLGMPNHKLNLYASYTLTENISLNPTMTYMGTKYSVTGIEQSTETYIVTQLNSKFLFNLNLRVKKLFVKGLEANISVYDLFNQKMSYPQAYSSGLAPLPGSSREFVLRISYCFGQKN